MIGGEEIRRSLAGAWRLFLNRPDGMRFFDVSVEGFWRSFGAIALVAPFYALTVLADRQSAPSNAIANAPVDGSMLLVDGVAALALEWVALPILLAVAAGPLGVARSYPAFVVARNWTTVIVAALYGGVALLFLIGLLGEQMSAVLTLAATVVVLRYNFIVARTALGAGIGLAAGLVAFDFLLSLLIAVGLDRLFGVAAQL